MYIRIDLSVFFVTQNVGETSKVEFSFGEKGENTLLFAWGERNLKKKFFRRRRVLFATWQTFVVGIIKSRRRKKRLLLSKKMLKIWQRVSVVIL